MAHRAIGFQVREPGHALMPPFAADRLITDEDNVVAVHPVPFFRLKLVPADLLLAANDFGCRRQCFRVPIDEGTAQNSEKQAPHFLL